LEFGNLKNKLKMGKQIFLLRHAFCNLTVSDALAPYGEGQAQALGEEIYQYLLPEQEVTIWTTLAERGQQTGKIIQNVIEQKVKVNFFAFRQLGGDENPCANLEWLKKEVDAFTGDNLIIISHQQCAEIFPMYFGLKDEKCGPACGILIVDGVKTADLRP
jgi:phosphohistidine phosphatase SixA